MVFVLHGTDTQASYLKLRTLVATFPNTTKQTIGKDTPEEFLSILQTQSLFAEKRIVIGENLISAKKVKAADLKNLPDSTVIILREEQALTPATQRQFLTVAKVEEFKLPQTLFYFLDSLSPRSTIALKELVRLKKTNTGVIWHLQNRLLLLLLAKLGLSQQETSEIGGRQIADWQWQKLTSQAYKFDLTKLKTMFAASLKIETLIKTGTTQTPESTLISLMLSRYLFS